MSLWENERKTKTTEQAGVIDITKLPVAHFLEILAPSLISRWEVAGRIGLGFNDIHVGIAQENAAIKVVPIYPQIQVNFQHPDSTQDPLLVILRNDKNEHPYGPFNAAYATAVGMITKALQDKTLSAYFQARKNNARPFSADALLNKFRVNPETLFLFWLGLQSAVTLTSSPTLRERMHPKARPLFKRAAASIIQDSLDLSNQWGGVSPQLILPAILDDMRTLRRVDESFQSPFIPSAFLMHQPTRFDADELRARIHETRNGYFHFTDPLEVLLGRMRSITTTAYYHPVVQ